MVTAIQAADQYSAAGKCDRAHTKVFYMGFTNLVRRPKGMSMDTPVIFAEARAHEARPIATWYEIGDSIGHQFLYQ